MENRVTDFIACKHGRWLKGYCADCVVLARDLEIDRLHERIKNLRKALEYYKDWNYEYTNVAYRALEIDDIAKDKND